MASRTSYLFDEQDLTRNANQVKELTVETRVEAGIVSREDADAFIREHTIVAVKKGWLGKAIDTVLNIKDDDLRLVVTKIVN